MCNILERATLAGDIESSDFLPFENKVDAGKHRRCISAQVHMSTCHVDNPRMA